MTDPRVLNLRDLRRPHRPGQPAAGFDLPVDATRVDRRSPWGNPYAIGEGGHDRAWAIAEYRAHLAGRLKDEPRLLEPLRGRRLACWCAPLACHAEVILEALDHPDGALAWAFEQAA